MKKILYTLFFALVTLCSCQKNEFSSNDIIGEWKATKIEATFSNGNVLTITDSEDIADELEGLEWINVTERNIRPMSYGGYELLIPYEINDNYIVFSGAESDATYKLESVSSNEMVIKYTSNWTSLIFYKRVK